MKNIRKNFFLLFLGKLQSKFWCFIFVYINSVQFSCSVFVTPWTAACQASLPIANSQSLLKLMCIESEMASNHLILYRPLLLPSWIFPSIRVFSDESVLCITWPKFWSFSFTISPSSEYSVFPTLQGTLKSLFQHQNSKASILWHSAFFIVQPAHPHMTTGKTKALTTLTFVGKTNVSTLQ